MEQKFFLVQIKHTSNVWEKGVVVKNSLDGARQSYHAYLGAYGYGNNAQTDYVACYIVGIDGEFYDSMVDNRTVIEQPSESEI